MAQPEPARRPGPDATIAAMHAALGHFVQGDPRPFQALLSAGPDVTLANPFGPLVTGLAAVVAATDAAATRYRDGEVVGTERIFERVDERLAAIVELEHLRAVVPGAEEATAFTLRVTTVLAHEAGAWRIVVRHADPTAAPRRAEDVFGTA